MPITADSKKILNVELDRLRALKQNISKQIDTLKIQSDDLKKQADVIQKSIDAIKGDVDKASVIE